MKDDFPKVMAVETYLDGGTIELLVIDKNTMSGRPMDIKFCIDHRIDTDTPGMLYWGYPDNSLPVTNTKILNIVLNALADYTVRNMPQ